MANKKSLYIETTIPSYATARDSFNALNMVRKTQTNEFWDAHKNKFRLLIGEPTSRECAKGDSVAARKRMDFIAGINELSLSVEAEKLADEYQQLLKIPDEAKTDCEHLAICVLNCVDYLLTWNMGHLGPATYDKLREYNAAHDLWTPKLVTPETIFGYMREDV